MTRYAWPMDASRDSLEVRIFIDPPEEKNSGWALERCRAALAPSRAGSASASEQCLYCEPFSLRLWDLQPWPRDLRSPSVGAHGIWRQLR